MTDEDFIVGYLKLFPEKNYNEDSAKVLCGILDQSKDGLVISSLKILANMIMYMILVVLNQL